MSPSSAECSGVSSEKRGQSIGPAIDNGGDGLQVSGGAVDRRHHAASIAAVGSGIPPEVRQRIMIGGSCVHGPAWSGGEVRGDGAQGQCDLS